MDNPISILFAEDNPQDVRLLKYALSQLDSPVNLLHYPDGQELLAAVPSLYAASIACVLVDLNMPFVDGFEVIAQLRANEDFCHVPIIVFTNTNSNEYGGLHENLNITVDCLMCTYFFQQICYIEFDLERLCYAERNQFFHEVDILYTFDIGKPESPRLVRLF